MGKNLLDSVFYGSELNKLDVGTRATQSTLSSRAEFKDISPARWDFIRTIVSSFFSKPRQGQFGGPITAGDAFFIASFMEALKPRTMIEVGVCSGVSSAFILYAAQQLGLLTAGDVFLYSFDLVHFHGEENQDETGVVVKANYDNLLEFWSLNVEVTTPDLLHSMRTLSDKVFSTKPTLAFIDADHSHPWPFLDTMILQELMPKNSWVLLQDTQVTERWYADTVTYNVPMPIPCRGVNLVSTLWPDDKIIGFDMCFNMAAIKLSLKRDEKLKFMDDILAYQFEASDETIQKNKANIFLRLKHRCGLKSDPSQEDSESLANNFYTKLYKNLPANRFWWWNAAVNHDPLLYYILDDKEKSLLDEWYVETESRKFIGESCAPFMGFLQGIIANNNIKRIVELGHYAGYSTLNIGFLLKHLGSGRLCTIDINETVSAFTKSFVDRAQLSNHVKVVAADSADPKAVDQALEYIGGQPDIVIIDSSHTYEGTLKELDLWMPVLRENGFIFFHDASVKAQEYDKQNMGGVNKAIKDWCEKNNYKYFIINDLLSKESLVYRDGCGLGIIQKNK